MIFTIHTCSYIQENFHLAPFRTCRGDARADGTRDRPQIEVEQDVWWRWGEAGRTRTLRCFNSCNVFINQQVCQPSLDFLCYTLELETHIWYVKINMSLVTGSLAPREGVFGQTDVTLYVLVPAMLLFLFTTQPYRRFPWNVTMSRGHRRIQIALNINPCSRSHVTPCMKCSWIQIDCMCYGGVFFSWDWPVGESPSLVAVLSGEADGVLFLPWPALGTFNVGLFGSSGTAGLDYKQDKTLYKQFRHKNKLINKVIIYGW